MEGPDFFGGRSIVRDRKGTTNTLRHKDLVKLPGSMFWCGLPQTPCLPGNALELLGTFFRAVRATLWLCESFLVSGQGDAKKGTVKILPCCHK